MKKTTESRSHVSFTSTFPPLIHISVDPPRANFLFLASSSKIVSPLKYSPQGARATPSSSTGHTHSRPFFPPVTTVVFYKEVHFVPRLLSRALEGRRTCVGYDEADDDVYEARRHEHRERDVGFRPPCRNDVTVANFIVGLSTILALRDLPTLSSGTIRVVSMFIGNFHYSVTRRRSC